jgi:hypothetical protein
LPAIIVIVLAAFMRRNTDEVIQKVVVTERHYDDRPYDRPLYDDMPSQ